MQIDLHLLMLVSTFATNKFGSRLESLTMFFVMRHKLYSLNLPTHRVFADSGSDGSPDPADVNART